MNDFGQLGNTRITDHTPVSRLSVFWELETWFLDNAFELVLRVRFPFVLSAFPSKLEKKFQEPCEVVGFGEKVVKISAGYRHSAAITGLT